VSARIRRGVFSTVAMLWLCGCAALETKAVCHGPWVPVNSGEVYPNG